MGRVRTSIAVELSVDVDEDTLWQTHEKFRRS
jgi:hypothetical protein